MSNLAQSMFPCQKPQPQSALPVKDDYGVENFRPFTLITLDFETYYGTKYTLKSLPTSEYIRDNRFRVHGVGVSINGQPAEYWYGLEIQKLYFIDWSNACVICHHTQFDGLILYEKYGIRPKIYSDTLSMSRAIHQGRIPNDLDSLVRHYQLGQKGAELVQFKDKRFLTERDQQILGGYCKNDVDLTFKLWKVLAPQLPPAEHSLIDLTIEMFCCPRLHVDRGRATRALTLHLASKEALVAASGLPKTTLSSRPKFAKAIRELGIEPPMKRQKPTKKISQEEIDAQDLMTEAFAKNDLEWLAFKKQYPEYSHIWQAREAVSSTITETRIKRVMLHQEGNRLLPIYLLYWGAHTGRWSGGDKINPQNFTRGSELRRSILAPPGYVLVVCDSAQIEARTLAWLAEEEWLIQAFREGRDIYSEFASTIYNRPIDRKNNPDDYIPGFVGKVSILGLGYQMGHLKFNDTLAAGAMGGPPIYFAQEETQRIVQTYRARNPRIKQLWQFMQDMLVVMMSPDGHREYKGLIFTHEKVRLPNGTYLHYPDLKFEDGSFMYRDGDQWKYIYGGLLTENIVQALARIIIGDQMLEIRPTMPIVLSTHDEVVGIVPEAFGPHCVDWMEMILSKPPEWCPDLPLAAEGGYAREYSK